MNTVFHSNEVAKLIMESKDVIVIGSGGTSTLTNWHLSEYSGAYFLVIHYSDRVDDVYQFAKLDYARAMVLRLKIV